MKYSAENIILNKHPELRQLPNGKWKEIWDIILKTPISRKIDLKDISKKLSSEDIFDKDYECDIQIDIKEEKYLKLCVTLFRDSNPYHHDYSIFAIYKMFEKIEELLGDIDTIQGQKIEDRWFPNAKMREKMRRRKAGNQ